LRPTLALLGRIAVRALVAGVVGLALLEVVLRLAGLPEGVGSVRGAFDLDDSTLGPYEAGGRIFVAWPREVAFQASFNSLGCRGPEPQLGDRPPILAIGDSYTFGFGVSDGQTWPAVLERRLREARIESSVINFASPRLTIEDQIRYVRRALPVLKPDIVILLPSARNGGGWLDENGLTPHQMAVEETRRRRGGSWLRPAIRSLAISEARFVGSHWRRQLVAEGRGEYPPLSLDKPIPSEPEDMGRYERGVAEAKALVESHGAALVLVSLPALGSKDGMMTMGRSWAGKTASEVGVHYLDLYAAYSAHPNLNELFLLPYDDHPSPLGHEVTADAVLAVLRDARLVD
jgi:lysophospholipase L1-like esterase